ncbi:Crp/Fnr family transcriptional regulator [Nitrosomonas supralitoralis]|uniref:Crp/Fnr family transcriptional regulator n=1 Tax=Nitrosomonas supralitoralis TaxID=2116706 RepID=A0A2P7NSN1_9PROT|nr:Crp/Fnr family transcriptional regulator [Nitrosomonas supralitoralis]PSJ16483.1 Crp/Fnr family transcriptional regulator [Nitrosomonas supralitoralis]
MPVSIIQTIPIPNRLLAALPRKDYVRFLADCEEVELALKEVLYHPGEHISYVYFPINSFISLATPLEDITGLEVGLVGNEGMFGVTLLLGVNVAPLRALVQGPGLALRITTPLFLRMLEQSSALERELKRYLYVLISQIAQTAACNRFHMTEARLARWLLMTQDKSHSNTFHFTHLFLAYMLGVRRVSITQAASSLQYRNIINYQRGNITILDRGGLEALSCSCYRSDKEIYQRVMG